MTAKKSPAKKPAAAKKAPAKKPAAKKSAAKNVLILLGSPREDGNSTRLAFAFADAACAAGHRVQSIRVPALDFAPCDVCEQCRPSAKAPCILSDDLLSVYPMLREADVLVFATPLHFHCWSSPLKMLIDRLYCLSPYRKFNLVGKSSLLLGTSADARPVAFSGLRASYRLTAEFMQWKNLGELLVGGLGPEGAIDGNPAALAKAAKLAAKI